MLSWLKHQVLIGGLIIAILGLSWSLWQGWQRRRSSERSLDQLNQEVVSLRLEVDQLTTQTTSSTLSFEQEKVMRDELLLQRPGEIVLQLPHITQSDVVNEPIATPTPWQKWRQLLSS
jgi:hypothetical protein